MTRHHERLRDLERRLALRAPAGSPIDTLRLRAADIIASRALCCLATEEEAAFFSGTDDTRTELLETALDRLAETFDDTAEPDDDYAVAEWHAAWSSRAAWRPEHA